MYIPHAYINIDGIEYYDYKLVTHDEYEPWRSSRYEDPKYVALSDKVQAILTNPIEYGLAQDIKIPKGTDIHIIPSNKNPYAIDDLRKYYNLKKNLDGGDYNVAVFLTGSDYSFWRNYQCFAVFPNEKVIYAVDTVVNEIKLMHYAVTDVKEINAGSQMLYYKHGICFNWYKLNPQYLDILKGNLKKPLVGIENLDINSTQELTMDVLTILIHSGNAWYHDKDARENFVLNLNLVNQYNWREYPGTMSLVFDEFMGRGSTKRNVENNLSKYNKVVKDLMNSNRYPVEFASEKDFNLGMALIERRLGVGQCRFTDYDQLQNHLRECDISMTTFTRMYSNVMKIQPKKYEAKEVKN